MLEDLFIKSKKYSRLDWNDQKEISALQASKNGKHLATDADYVLYKQLGILFCYSGFVNFRFVVSRLAILFGDYDSAISYVQRAEKTYDSFHEFCSHVLSLKMPKTIHYSRLFWQELAKNKMPSRIFEKVFAYADKIERYIKINEEKLKSKIAESITHQYRDKILEEWNHLECKVKNVTESHFVLQQLEQMKFVTKKEINKQWDDAVLKFLNIKRGIWSEQDRQRVNQYKLSDVGKAHKQDIECEVYEKARKKILQQYQNKSRLVAQGKDKYIAKRFAELETVIQRRQAAATSSLLSHQSDLNQLLGYAACAEYQCPIEFMDLAKQFLSFGLDKEDFLQYQSLEIVDDNQHIPPVRIEGIDIGYPDVVIEKISPFDPLCAVLGQLTGCCQSLGDQGEDSTLHGITSPYGGFYVVRLMKTNEIIAQCWAWRGKDNGLVFDSIERQVQYRQEKSEAKEQMIADCFAQLAVTLVQHYDVPKVLVGIGGKTPHRFRHEYELLAEIPIDYAEEAYRDSMLQCVLSGPGKLKNAYLNGFAFDAARKNALPALRHYLDQGVDVNLKCQGDTLLAIAALHPDDSAMVRLLLDYGADVTVMSNGSWPIEIAANQDNWNAVKEMLHAKTKNDIQVMFSHALYFNVLLLAGRSAKSSALDVVHFLVQDREFIAGLVQVRHKDKMISEFSQRENLYNIGIKLLNCIQEPSAMILFLNTLFEEDQQGAGLLSKKVQDECIVSLPQFYWKGKEVSHIWCKLLQFAADKIMENKQRTPLINEFLFHVPINLYQSSGFFAESKQNSDQQIPLCEKHMIERRI